MSRTKDSPSSNLHTNITENLVLPQNRGFILKYWKNSRMRLCCSISLIPLLLILILVPLLTTKSAAQSPISQVIFTPWNDPPVGWSKHIVENLTATNSQFFAVRGSPSQFTHILLASSLSYVFSAPKTGRYVVRIGSYERKGCIIGRRGFQYIVNGVSSPLFSVSEQVGCDSAYYTDISFTVGDDLLIRLKFDAIPGRWISSISNFELFSSADSTSETPVPTVVSVPSPPPTSVDPTDVNIELDTGPDFSIAGTTSITHSGTISTSGISNVPSNVFRTSRQGMEFELRFDLKPGVYDVELGFAEDEFCSTGERVFNVHMNGKSRLEAYDIYKAAGGCRSAVMEKLTAQAIDPLLTEPLLIQFKAVASDARLSFVRITSAREQCVPESADATSTSDHLAHSVPGSYPMSGAPSFVDRKGVGYVRVKIDGGTSHTHFSNNGISGRLISYVWTIPETGEIISTEPAFERDFPLGTTRLKLTVVDNVCSKHEAETSVSVTGNMQPGAYCYYYQRTKDVSLPGTLLEAPSPTFSAISKSVNFGFPSFPFDDSPFTARCIFSVPIVEKIGTVVVSVAVTGSNTVHIFEGADLVIDSDTISKSAPIIAAAGLLSFEVIYKHTDLSRPASLSFMMNGSVPTNVVHDQSTVRPIITSVSPSSASIEGGGRVKVSGFGLYRPLVFHFGSQTADAELEGATSTEVFALAPFVTDVDLVDFKVENSIGYASNVLQFSYTTACDDVKFDKSRIITPDGENIPLLQPTCVALWQDGKLYLGTRVGNIQVVEYDRETLVTKSICHSDTLADERYLKPDGTFSPREFLGITFDPRDTVPKPYVSVSTMFWEKRAFINRDNKKAWSNGAVERFMPATAETLSRDPTQCLQHDRNIVSNLPVGDGDHSVSEIVFSQGGDLLITVGGFTNMGLPLAVQTGNWETYFSASVVRAKLSKGIYFNGIIPYTTPENLRTAAPIRGYTDVEIYATGFRNPFTLAMARTGKIYALDNGPNCGYGNASSSCSEYVEADAALRSTSKKENFPGAAVLGTKEGCKYSAKRHDKLLEVKEGRFYGHPNIQRAILTQSPGECAYVDPLTNVVPPPFNSLPPSNYEPVMAMVRSPKTGLREYGSNVFCGKMRGDLIISQLNSRGVTRVVINENGGLNGNPFELTNNGGLRVEENVHGDLLFPIYGILVPPGILIMKPQLTSRTGLLAVNALPFRHGRAGGTLLTVGGWGFETGASVEVGGTACPVGNVTPTEIVCRVPAHDGIHNSVSVSVTMGEVSSELSGAVLYMDV